jgi:hypothetical protein
VKTASSNPHMDRSDPISDIMRREVAIVSVSTAALW